MGEDTRELKVVKALMQATPPHPESFMIASKNAFGVVHTCRCFSKFSLEYLCNDRSLN